MSRHPSILRIRSFRIAAGLTGILLLFLAISNLLAPWVTQAANPADTQPELHRWFVAFSGAVDLIGAICLLTLALRPRGQELLAINFGFGIAIAAIIVIPFTPGFAVLLVVFVPVLALFPYRGELAPRTVMQPRPPRIALALASCTVTALLAIAVQALSNQMFGNDSAAQAGTWAEYAEHLLGLALASLLAISSRPGWRVLRASCTVTWLYLGFVATFVLPQTRASWGIAGGITALMIGAFYLAASLRAPIRKRHP
jgi:hypothetical protein